MLAKGLGVTDVHPMADFVNYNKRSIDLPPGCKDMIDVLRVQEEARDETQAKPSTSFKAKRREQASGPLSAIEEYVQKLYKCGDENAVLWIETPDSRLSAGFLKREKSIIAWVNFQKESKDKQIVRDFLSNRGMNQSSLPVEIMCTLSPLPAEPAEVSRLLLDLFHALGLKYDWPMNYHLVQWVGGWPDGSLRSLLGRGKTRAHKANKLG